MSTADGLTAFCGYLADRYPFRRIPLLLGLFMLGSASALYGLAQTVQLIILSRVLQGFSTALVYTASFSLLIDTVRKDEVGQWMGTIFAFQDVGILVGPLVGGTVYARVGLWGVMGCLFAAVIIDAVMRFIMIEQRQAKSYGISSFEGSSRSEPDTHDSDNVSRDASQRGSGDDASVYSVEDPDERSKKHECRAKLPPTVRLLMSPRVLAGILGVFTRIGALVAFDATVPLFVKRTFQWSSFGAGAIFVTIVLPGTLGPIAGKLADRFGVRAVAATGCIVAGTSFLLLRLVHDDSIAHIALLCCFFVLAGKSVIRAATDWISHVEI